MRRVFLIEDLPQVAEHLKNLLEREQEVEYAGVEPKAEQAIAHVTAEKPDIVLVDALLQGKITGLEVAKRIRAAVPATRIVVVTVPQKPVEPRPHEGVDAVFVLPGGANELAGALGAGKTATRRTGKGQMVAVYSPKGGTGKTSIAMNLATVLRRNSGSVALFDAVMQFGAVRHLLPVPLERRSVVDLPPGAAMRAVVMETVWESPDGVAVLLAPARPEESDLVPPAEIANAMQLLADHHDFVVVDTAPRLADDTLAVLDAANTIVLLITYSPVTVANARAAIDTFAALGYTGHKTVLLAANSPDGAPGMGRAAAEHALGMQVVAEIPHEPKLFNDSATKQQAFVVAEPTSGAAKAVQALATAVITQQRR